MAVDSHVQFPSASQLVPTLSTLSNHLEAAESSKQSDDAASVESGYGSGPSSASSSTARLPRVSLTSEHLRHLNKQLESMEPMDVLRFIKIFFPRLYQTTAFGLTGLVTIDMLSKLEQEGQSNNSQRIDLIFLDTLYHFQETYDLVDRVRARYPGSTIHTFKPDGFETAAEFEATYGRLYEVSEEMYDYLAKVEPQERAYDRLDVVAVLTGRRRSQGGQRGQLDIIEVDGERGIFKINPLANWSFGQVQAYVREHNVPYNALLDRGYKSIGDWHSTVPVGEGEDERAGRWKGRDKTECGIHNKQSRYNKFLAEPVVKASLVLSAKPAADLVA
ncbi:phosphoadenosine phosphosulfate reductase [Grosmannia clavigera kw1407]|uniref:phosphoadenylyl-sulfate reductase (thioredoxin) n=1 Tax=Grosmannia clavigera (strain kw1407 / UAMH 11150) TaxID=655863 RepID=F0XJY2_GROCL|nr:phosphoadenosine phosphosulfate reductase [Grosmannia clavigera kw1407]EFX01912.1 phosphoadenosine phosphosulfate reductase [Grosmannia clavigera kw1407]